MALQTCYIWFSFIEQTIVDGEKMRRDNSIFFLDKIQFSLKLFVLARHKYCSIT